ncbi:MAG: mercuric reductase [Cyclobacteriaceae bacterium]
MKHFDHMIIGTGQATGTLLGKLSTTGDSIVIIEGNKVGGSCVNYGCTPTKTMVASAKALYQARRGDFFGFQAEPVVDFARVMTRMNEIRNASADVLRGWIESVKQVTLIYGWARFSGKKTVEVDGEQISADKIYINVGTSPATPPIKGLSEVPWLDSARLLELTALPKHLIVVGGGYIGVEFAQVFRRLGSEVTIIQHGDQLMPQEDAEVANNIQEIIETEGIKVMLKSNAQSISYDGSIHRLELEQNGSTSIIEGDQLLIAAGRTPNTKELSLASAGLEINERGYINVNDFCETNVAGVFAVGDVNGHGAFTHTAVNDAEIVIDFLYGGNRKLSNRIPVYALFSDPPLGRVGMTEKEALAKGHKIMKASRQMNTISRAKEMGETQGLAKLIVDAESDLILGAAILGPGGDEIINMFAAIMHSGIPCRNYREVVLVHPTVSELMPYVLDGLKVVE